VGAVAVTTGAEGASWVSRDGVVSVPSTPSECVDSTGAGDAFDAGLLVALLAGKAPEECLRAGTRLGAKAVGQVGAQPSRR
jgi:sugar/nucleoside kinase (ribokinase family)